MKNITSQKALSLMEVVVGMVLTSIVLFGLNSVSTMFFSSNTDYGQRAVVNAQTQAILSHILYNASLAVGSGQGPAGGPNVADADGNYYDQGILVGKAGSLVFNNINTFCIHQPAANNVTTVTTTPYNGGDIWLCYTHNPGTKVFQYCVTPYPGLGPNPRGATPCVAGNPNLTIPNWLTPRVLGSVFSIVNRPGVATIPRSPYFNMLGSALNTTAGGNQLGFSIIIENCLDNNAATCNNPDGVSSDPANNPEVVKSGNVNPPQQGMYNP